MWTQIVGKIRLALTRLINQWWNVPLHVNARGLTTSPIPYRNHPCELWFDFLDQQLVLQLSAGGTQVAPAQAYVGRGFLPGGHGHSLDKQLS